MEIIVRLQKLNTNIFGQTIYHSNRLPTRCNNFPFFFGGGRGRNSPQWARASSFMRFLDHTQRRTTFGRTPLDEWSARRRDLYLTTHNNHNRQISMPPGGIRTHDLSRRVAADLRLRPRGHWDRLFSLLSWRLFTAQHVSGVLPPIIRSSTTAVAASGFTFVSWW